MKFSCPNSLPSRWMAFLLALALSGSSSFAQNVSGFVHAKIQNFQQTSPAAPVVNSTSPFQFGSIIQMGTANISSAMVTFTGTSSPRSYTGLPGGDFSILDTFTTLNDLNAAYSFGNYNLSIVTDAGTFTRSLFFFPFSYPTTPMLTVPANNWQSGMLVIDAAADYTFTWNAFIGGGATDGIEVVVREAGLTFGPLPATQTSLVLPAGSLDPGTTYNCDLAFLRGAGTAAADQNIGQGLAALVKDTSFLLRTQTPALALVSAVSRKTHGAGGDFDVDLPLSGTSGVECRSGGASGAYTIVITFTNMVVSGNATVTSGIGSVSGTPTFNSNTMTINLTGVANAQMLTLTLSNVIDQFSQTLPDTAVNVAFLLGDSNANRTVNASDVSQTKARIGQTLDATNFRSDVNVNGSINATDTSLIKLKVGTGVP